MATEERDLKAALAAVSRWKAAAPTHDSVYQKWILALAAEVERLNFIQREFHNLDDVAEIARLRADLAIQAVNAKTVTDLQAEVKRLRDALREIAGYQGLDSDFDYTACQMRKTARSAVDVAGDA